MRLSPWVGRSPSLNPGAESEPTPPSRSRPAARTPALRREEHFRFQDPSGLETPKEKVGQEARTRVGEGLVHGGLGRSSGKLRDAFQWLSGFISEKEIWLKISSPRCCRRTMPLTVFIALSEHYLMASSQVQRRGARWHHPLFTDADTDSGGHLVRSQQTTRALDPNPDLQPPASPTHSCAHPMAGVPPGWQAVAQSRERQLEGEAFFLFFGASCSKPITQCPPTFKQG